LQVEDGMKTHEQFADDLALYALEELTGSERRELEQHLDTCASCWREVQALRGDLSLLALSGAGPRPPARSKDRLMRAIAAEPRGVSASSPAAVPRRGLSWGLIPAVVALGLLVAVGTLWTKNQGLRHNLESLARLYRGTGEQLQQANERLRLLSAPDAVQVSLSPQSEPRKPHATAIYSPSQRRMMLMASNLAPVPAGKAYELWIIPTEGAPINAGVFKPDERGNAVVLDHAMPEGVVAKAFAVTIEDEAGSDKPTSPILIVGAGE
jgi:anti-sigma-K factor RskA